MSEASDTREPFVMFPEWLMARADISDGAKMLWAYLRDRERRFGVGNVFEGRETIARAIGTNVDGYKLRSRQLQAAGMLRVETKAGAYGQNIFCTVEPTQEGRGENSPTRGESAPTRMENSPTRGESAPEVGGKTHRRSGGKPPIIQKKNQKKNQTSVDVPAPLAPNEVRAALERGFKRQTGTSIPRTTEPSRGQLAKLATQAASEPGGDPVAALETLGAELGKRRANDPWRLLLSAAGGFGLMPADACRVSGSTPEIVKLEARIREIEELSLDGIENPDEEKRLTDERLVLLGRIKQLRTRATEAA